MPIHHIYRLQNENQLSFAVTLMLPQRLLTSRIRKPTNTTPGIHSKKEKPLKSCLIVALLILSDIYTPTKKTFILGGRIGSMQGRETSVGG